MNDDDFLRQLQSGDGEAFARLVAAYRKDVINICYRFLLNREDAEDVSQEVFVEIYHALKKFRGDSKLSTWIYRVAVTKSLDEIKKQKRQKRITSFGKILGIDDFVHWLAGGTRPDKILEAEEDYTHLLNALNKLPDNQRIALTLSKIEGYTNPEIAEIMQTTLTGVDSLIYRAKNNLKPFLTPE